MREKKGTPYLSIIPLYTFERDLERERVLNIKCGSKISLLLFFFYKAGSKISYDIGRVK